MNCYYGLRYMKFNIVIVFNARNTIKSRFDISFTAQEIHKLYDKLSVQ